MKALFVRYLNEIVGLTVMALMATALIAGQADAEVRKAAAEQEREILEIRLIVAEK
ncbi:MAG: hypothetical protein QNI96_01480 [Woeseiaceae bacterium]|nr:hypothetical protein [Woeseiaceae bacterium]